jgi:hypothetical protein
MTQIVLEGNIVEKLLPLSEPVELCDPSGQVLGEFRPRLQVSSKLPEGFKSPFSREELDAALRDPRRYTTKEVLEHLKSL